MSVLFNRDSKPKAMIMSELKQQQSALLQQIFSLNSEQASQGVQIYQTSLLANATRALAITYATTHSLMGANVFQQVVKAFIAQQGKAQFDWGEYAHQLPEFISQLDIAKAQLFSDIAKLDLACHQAERSADSEIDFASLTLLNQVDAYQLKIEFAAGFQLITTEYPVDKIIADIQQMTAKDNPLVHQQVSHQLGKYKQAQCHFLIWRVGFQAKYQKLSQSEFFWLQQWHNAVSKKELMSIGLALDQTQKQIHPHAAFAFEQWLPFAINAHQICAVSVISHTH